MTPPTINCPSCGADITSVVAPLVTAIESNLAYLQQLGEEIKQIRGIAQQMVERTSQTKKGFFD